MSIHGSGSPRGRLFPGILLALAGCQSIGLDPLGTAANESLDIRVTPDELAFGTVSPASEEGAKGSLTATNMGESQVAFKEVRIEGDTTEAFEVVEFHSKPLQSAENKRAEFSFLPASRGSFSAEALLVFEKDGVEVEIKRRLLGQGCADDNQDGVCNTDALIREDTGYAEEPLP